MKERIAEALLETEAVFLRPEDPFTWASGIKSPIYCDNRLTLSVPEVRTVIEEAFAKTVKAEFEDADILMGTSTAGIPHAAIAAHILGMPMGYVRAGAKGHGRQNRIEGKISKGQKAVVIEDLISTGGSSVEVVNALREAGVEVLGIVSIFTYGTALSKKKLEENDVRNISLTDFDTVLEVAARRGYIKQSDIADLIEFRDSL